MAVVLHQDGAAYSAKPPPEASFSFAVLVTMLSIQMAVARPALHGDGDAGHDILDGKDGVSLGMVFSLPNQSICSVG